MKTGNKNDEAVIRYLLGDMPEPERAALEERYFTDDEFFEQYLAVKDALLDAYARGEISGRERELFEKNFLTSPARRQRIESTRDLIRVTSEEPTSARPVTQSAVARWASPLLALVRMPSPAWRYSLAAVVLVLTLGGLWLVYDRKPQPEQALRREEIEVAAPGLQQSTDGDTGNTAVSDADRPEETSNEVNRRPAGTGEQPARRVPPNESQRGHERRQAIVASLTLTPGLVRSPNEGGRLTVPVDAETVRLRLELEGERFDTYRVVLQTADGEVVRRWHGLRESRANSGRAIILSFPPDLLVKKDYTLALGGVRPGGGYEDVADYYFKVHRR